jgi:alpha-tubulin suppressor-like RCC1 family protein
VTTGFGHSCGIATDRQLYCWGWNGYFQIGDGTNTSRNAPVNARFSVPIYLPGN